MREIFSSFEAVSGAKLNVNKTNSIDIGDVGGPNTLLIPWLHTTNTVKILGVVFTNSIRQMVKLNWDKMATNFAQLVWMHTARSLSLHQKISLLNIFISSKMWYLSSTLPPSPIHIGKITATMGSFLWSRIPARIPIVQLARHREKGGLKLQLPGFKCKALLINRHIKEIDSMPYYKSLLTPIIPSPAIPSPTSPIPADLPDAKLLRQQLTSISPHILQNSSTNLIHSTFIEQTDEPKVVRNHPNQQWSKIWRNIASPHFTAAQKNTLYMLVNEKIPHRKLYHIIGRANGEDCVYCNTPVETIQHKFCECPRVAEAWALVQRKVSSFRPGRRLITFEDLLRPSLTDIPAAS